MTSDAFLSPQFLSSDPQFKSQQVTLWIYEWTKFVSFNKHAFPFLFFLMLKHGFSLESLLITYYV